jgi:hypothetical protein
MKQRLFGQAIHAADVVCLPAEAGASALVRLAGALISRGVQERVGRYAVPEITERPSVPDGGVDAEYITPENLPGHETGGLIGPGRTVFQFKFRDATRADRKSLLRELSGCLRDEFPRVAPTCARYVLMINLELSGAERKKLREAALGSWPAFTGKPLVIWGAADIAQALNSAPDLRHLFFADSGLCTLDFAATELRRAYGTVGWASFVNRDHERAAIVEFVGDIRARVLEVAGPAYSGKTRLVIEALQPYGSRVVWASSPDSVSLGLFRDLDQSDDSYILVVDRCDAAAIPRILDFAREQRHLKTVVIRTGAGHEDTLGVLSVGPLPDAHAIPLIHEIAPELPFLQQSWVDEEAGGIPGLLVHLAALLRDQPATLLGATDIRRQRNRLVESRYLSALSAEARRVLEVASLVPVLGVEGQVAGEVEVVSKALDVPIEEVRARLPELERAGLVRRRGRFIEVAPPLLAEYVLSQALERPEHRSLLLELWVAVDAAVFRRFLERLSNVPGDAVRNAIAGVLVPGGLIKDLDSLVRNAETLEALAPAAPQAALASIERSLKDRTAEELHDSVKERARRSLVGCLERLALRAEFFLRATRLLFRLAEAENETWGNNATGVVTSLFHWNHSEVSATLVERLAALREASEQAPPPRRLEVVARACGAAFKEDTWIGLHHAKGPALPEAPYRPETWEEVRRYGEGILTILLRLAKTPVPAVSNAAAEGLLRSLRPFVRISRTETDYHALGKRSVEAVQDLGERAESARLLSQALMQLELTEASLCSAPDQADRVVKETLELVRAALARLSGEGDGDFRAQLWRWVGPRSWKLDALEEDRSEVSARVEDLAREVARRPEIFLTHVDWLLSDDAEHRIAFFQALGREDKGSGLLGALISRAVAPAWAAAFTAYMIGSAQRDASAAEAALDRLGGGSDVSVALGVLQATCAVASPETVAARLLRLLHGGALPRHDFARTVAHGLAWERITEEDVRRVIEAMDDGTVPVRAVLLWPFLVRLLRGAPVTGTLRGQAWRFIESTVGAPRPVVGRSWDLLATELGKLDESARLLGVVERFMESRLHEPVSIHDEIPLASDALNAKIPSEFVGMLLRLVVKPHTNYSIDWELGRAIEPLRDREVLLGFAREAGVEGAHLVAANLDPEKQGFWPLAADLLAASGYNERVEGRLLARLGSGSWSGSPVSMIKRRIEVAKSLLSHGDPKVVTWARQTLASLEDWRQRALGEDREEWIWDYRIGRAALEEMLARKDSPERLWAIGRLLEDAPLDRVRKLLTRTDILDALPKLQHLDEATRTKWEQWARSGSDAR